MTPAVLATVLIYTIMAVGILSIFYGTAKRVYDRVRGNIKGSYIERRNNRLGLTSYTAQLHSLERNRALLQYNVRAMRTGEYPIASDYNDCAEEGYTGEAA